MLHHTRRVTTSQVFLDHNKLRLNTKNSIEGGAYIYVECIERTVN